MARIKNIELPGEKHTCIGLTEIYGIGRSLAKTICEDAKVEPTKKVKDLTEDEVALLRKEIDKYVVEGDLRRDVQMNIKNKMEINCYQGVRHKKGLPVRGQYNNTIVTICDKDGNAISWSSAGRIGYKGSKKKTPFAAGLTSEAAAAAAVEQGVKKVDVYVKGLGPGRENAIRSLQTAGLEITSIIDETPVPHNGCRPPKRPRK